MKEIRSHLIHPSYDSDDPESLAQNQNDASWRGYSSEYVVEQGSRLRQERRRAVASPTNVSAAICEDTDKRPKKTRKKSNGLWLQLPSWPSRLGPLLVFIVFMLISTLVSMVATSVRCPSNTALSFKMDESSSRLRAAVNACASRATPLGNDASWKSISAAALSSLRDVHFENMDDCLYHVRLASSNWLRVYKVYHDKRVSWQQSTDPLSRLVNYMATRIVKLAASSATHLSILRIEPHRRPYFCRSEWKSLALERIDSAVLLIMSSIGFSGKRMVMELDVDCSGSAYMSAANSIVFQKFSAFLVYSCWSTVAMAEHALEPARSEKRVTIEESTAAQLNNVSFVQKLLLERNIQGELDLLSIFLNNKEYDVLEQLVSGTLGDAPLSPRIIVTEYQPYLGSSLKIVSKKGPELDKKATQLKPNGTLDSDTFPTGVTDAEVLSLESAESSWTLFEPRFSFHSTLPKRFRLFGGASISAFNALLSKSGFTLVGCTCSAPAAFFVRNDLAPLVFHAVYKIDYADLNADEREEISRRLQSQCIFGVASHLGKSWSRDFAGMWDAAAHYEWMEVDP